MNIEQHHMFVKVDGATLPLGTFPLKPSLTIFRAIEARLFGSDIPLHLDGDDTCKIISNGQAIRVYWSELAAEKPAPAQSDVYREYVARMEDENQTALPQSEWQALVDENEQLGKIYDATPTTYETASERARMLRRMDDIDTELGY